MNERIEIRNQSLARVKSLKFGDPVTNICAGEENPKRLAWFVDLEVKRSKNRFGIDHREYLALCTDSKGKFWHACIEVIYPGHLNPQESRELFLPVHAALYPGGEA